MFSKLVKEDFIKKHIAAQKKIPAFFKAGNLSLEGSHIDKPDPGLNNSFKTRPDAAVRPEEEHLERCHHQARAPRLCLIFL